MVVYFQSNVRRDCVHSRTKSERRWAEDSAGAECLFQSIGSACGALARSGERATAVPGPNDGVRFNETFIVPRAARNDTMNLGRPLPLAVAAARLLDAVR